MTRFKELQEYFTTYTLVSQRWRGLGEGPSISVQQGLKLLTSIASQNLSPRLALSARTLIREIVLGRSYSDQNKRKKEVV